MKQELRKLFEEISRKESTAVQNHLQTPMFICICVHRKEGTKTS